MLCLDDVENNRTINDQGFFHSQILVKLNKEFKLLADEKQKIIDSRENLLYILNKRIEAKERNNERLKLEIRKLKETCVKMARAINASIKFDIEQSARQ